MFAMVSSNLADLMGATRPRTSQNLYEKVQDSAETIDPTTYESAGHFESNDAEHKTNTTSTSI